MNRPGGTDRRIEIWSQIGIFANPAVGDRCPVLILDKYTAKLLANAFEKALL